jgi:hypothetical protein
MCDDDRGMAVYHVFVDGAADGSPAGKEQLATAIAGHYGMPVADVRLRITSGRFRVKGNCDRATADIYVRDLTALGALCSIEEATPSNAAKTPLPFPVVTVASKPALPPRQTTPPAIARTTSGGKDYQSGLSAAFSGAQQTGGLGALDDGSAFKLSSVDGNDNAPTPDAGAFGPPQEATPAAQPVAKAPPKAVAKPADVPLDIFAPPDADDENMSVQLADDEVERSAKRKVSLPPEAVADDDAAPRASRTSLQAPNAARSSRPSLQAPISSEPARTGLKDPRTRFVVGVVLAIALGFIPAHLFASMREKSAFADIDANVTELQHEAITPDDYAALDPMRTRQLERKGDARRNIAMIALLIWAAAGAGIAFGYFRATKAART